MEKVLAISYDDRILQRLQDDGWEIRVYDVSNEFNQFLYYEIIATRDGLKVCAPGRTLSNLSNVLEAIIVGL